ncbi:MAG: adenylosuccinate lyase [Solirubrobacterales bacterium]
MIARYARPEMAEIWSDQHKLECWLKVELTACEVLSEHGVIPAEDWAQISSRASFDAEAVAEREQVTNHDVAAFVDVVAESVGEAGRWIHYGLTSSDVLDTGLALQLKQAGRVIDNGATELIRVLSERANEFRDTPCVGRTHGVHAEPTTFGLKLAGFTFEAHRSRSRLARAFAQAEVGKLSGAVGTYSALEPAIERHVLERLGLNGEPIATQVVPRDRHAELCSAIALAGSSLERLATEVRHLQRVEVREAEEPFASGQKGSSAMPHKRNPILSERITGLARVLRGNAQVALENVALWHERDISHSSAERVILPDSTTLLDYMQSLAIEVIGGLTVYPERMKENLELTHGALFSQAVLTALVDAGMTRDDAYRIVQRNAQLAFDERRHLLELLREEAEVIELLDDKELEELFDYALFTKHLPILFERLEGLQTN